MINRKLLLTGTVGMVVALAGCFQGEQTMEEIDPPMEAEEVDQLEDPVAEENEDSENVEEEEESEAVEDVHAETVPREIYLIDSTGMVASQVIELPKIESKEVATQVLE